MLPHGACVSTAESCISVDKGCNTNHVFPVSVLDPFGKIAEDGPGEDILYFAFKVSIIASSEVNSGTATVTLNSDCMFMAADFREAVLK